MTIGRLAATWTNPGKIREHSYVCGYCGVDVGPNEGYGTNVSSNFVAICPRCNRPSFLDGATATPSAAFGAPVAHLPNTIEKLYNEARRCFQVTAYTCAALGLRTLLAHVAVEKGAKPNLRFQEYVKYLIDHHLAPAGSDAWVDSIRDLGNDAAHDLIIVTKEQAEQAMSFVEMILKVVYEYPARVTPSAPPTTP